MGVLPEKQVCFHYGALGESLGGFGNPLPISVFERGADFQVRLGSENNLKKIVSWVSF